MANNSLVFSIDWKALILGDSEVVFVDSSPRPQTLLFSYLAELLVSEAEQKATLGVLISVRPDSLGKGINFLILESDRRLSKANPSLEQFAGAPLALPRAAAHLSPKHGRRI